MIITIDGPAGGGKSTLSVMLAKELCFFCLNSGYLYRGMAYVLQTYYGYDEQKLKEPLMTDMKACIDSGELRYEYENGLAKIYFKDDITQFLKRIEVAKAAAILAQSPAARQVIREYKRALVLDKDTVIEGRVCGSVVFPQADVKFFVTASSEVRAQRVLRQQAHRGVILSFDEALESVVSRDKTDMSQTFDPRVKPKGSIEIDTSDLSKEQMLQKALNHVKEALKSKV